MAVAEPQQCRPAAIEQGVAGAFEAQWLGQRANAIAGAAEPVDAQRLLATALGMAEAAGQEVIAAHQAGIGGEHQVGQPGGRRQQGQFGVFAQSGLQGLAIARGRGRSRWR